jgi:hypothetical protein
VNLQLVIDKEQTILRKDNMIVLERDSKPNHEIPSIIYKRKDFLLCSSCFWCASCLSPDYPSPAKCPTCIDGNIESIPIAENEEYRFNNDIKRGITMEFLR